MCLPYAFMPAYNDCVYLLRRRQLAHLWPVPCSCPTQEPHTRSKCLYAVFMCLYVVHAHISMHTSAYIDINIHDKHTSENVEMRGFSFTVCTLHLNMKVLYMHASCVYVCAYAQVWSRVHTQCVWHEWFCLCRGWVCEVCAMCAAKWWRQSRLASGWMRQAHATATTPATSRYHLLHVYIHPSIHTYVEHTPLQSRLQHAGIICLQHAGIICCNTQV
jgi:hypothetical protein